MIDLGLPSGTKWACCNLGAKNPEDCGGHFAWGETKSKKNHSFNNYSKQLLDIETDIAGTRYDAATVNWGDSWQMPTIEQCDELINHCRIYPIRQNNVLKGIKFKGSNDNFIIIPAAGLYSDHLQTNKDEVYVWTSTPHKKYPGNAYRLRTWRSSRDAVRTSYTERMWGHSIRPVYRNASLTTKLQASAQLTSCSDNNHPHMIDLGLPSGTKWACCNVGAQKPEDYGNYFAWGETQQKKDYKWETYAHGSSATKVTNIGSDIAGTDYDAATANWGAPWRMPSLKQVNELKEKCTSVRTIQNGVMGMKFTGPNGGTIFLPSAGKRFGGNSFDVGEIGNYWSSTLLMSQQSRARFFVLATSGKLTLSTYLRYYGHSVRPVRNN
jgi:hypothetical protein